MRTLRHFLVIFSLTCAGSIALADVPAKMVETRKSFAISTIADHGGRVYYSCSAVRAAAKDLLTAMGATDLRVSCSGGLEHGTFDPTAVLSVRFANLVTAKAMEATHAGRYMLMNLTGRETNSGVSQGHSCHLMKDIFRATRKNFDLLDVDAKFQCSGTSFRSYEVSFAALMM